MQRLSVLLYPDEVQALIDVLEAADDPPPILRIVHEQLCFARQRGEATGRIPAEPERYVAVQLGSDTLGWVVLDMEMHEAVRHMNGVYARALAEDLNRGPRRLHHGEWESTRGWVTDPVARLLESDEW